VLRQEQLSERFDVSRTPIREALRRLAATGLVSLIPNKGVRVRAIPRDELRQAFMIRAELEALVTGIAAPRMTPQRLKELGEAQKQFAELTDQLLDRNRSESERTRLTGDWVRANYRFHDVIYDAADLPLVERIAKSARRTFLSRWSPGGPEIDDLYRQNVFQHQAILDALAAGSSDGARALAHEHVLHSGRLLEVILDHLAPQQEPTTPVSPAPPRPAGGRGSHAPRGRRAQARS
jgi:DNA-binding GntR family transcriptional regulator